MLPPSGRVDVCLPCAVGMPLVTADEAGLGWVGHEKKHLGLFRRLAITRLCVATCFFSFEAVPGDLLVGSRSSLG